MTMTDGRDVVAACSR